jgi:hypothetical protein
MAHSQSSCPICRKVIKDPKQEKCDQCYWVLNIENLLDSQIRNSLVEWAICHYQRAEELDRKDYNHSKLESRLNRQRDDIDRLQQTIDSFVNISEIKSILSSKERTIDGDKNTPEIEGKDVVNNDNSLSGLSNVKLSRPSQEEENLIPSTPLLTQTEQNIISEYYHNLSRFASNYNIKAVNVTKESISVNWGNEKKNVVLEEFNRGNYWIFNIENNIYLVPAQDIDVDQSTHTTTSTIFECHNYSKHYKKIQLIKPAIVKVDLGTNPQTWRLQEQGALEFS